MRLVRIVGDYKDGGEPMGIRAIILCALDDNDRLLDGEWFGYDRHADGAEFPFILRFGEVFDFGGDPKEIERTNLATKSLRVGEYFTTTSEHGGPEGWEVNCLITHVTNIHTSTSERSSVGISNDASEREDRELSPRSHKTTVRDIDQLKRKLAKESKAAAERSRNAAEAAAYARKSKKGMKKSQSNASKRDIYSRNTRLPGSAFAKKT